MPTPRTVTETLTNVIYACPSIDLCEIIIFFVSFDYQKLCDLSISVYLCISYPA